MGKNRRKAYEDLLSYSDDGIECDKCGCRHSYVVKTEKILGVIRRRRRCRHCGEAFYTIENK